MLVIIGFVVSLREGKEGQCKLLYAQQCTYACGAWWHIGIVDA